LMFLDYTSVDKLLIANPAFFPFWSLRV